MPAKFTFTQVFINLPVNDVVASTKFYEAIGAAKNPVFSDDTTSCMVFSEHIHVMIMTKDRFTTFIPTSKTIAEAGSATEVLLCLSTSSKNAVDETVTAAEAAGGKKDPTAIPGNDFMYGRSFEDLDGHVWELGFMDVNAMSKEHGANQK